MSSMFRFVNLLMVFLSFGYFSQKTYASEPVSCSYETWDWDTIQKKSVNHRKVTKSKSELTTEEIGSVAGCTVCEEDQVEIQIRSLPPFKVCRYFKERVSRAVGNSIDKGFPVVSAVGYRVGKSKGPLNSAGQRTQFSNHSYGTAIDINSEKNGLYDSCVQFSPQCHILRGGEYRQGNPGTITKTSEIYQLMVREGFKWGGEIDGKQKDFMHFSPNGM